LDLPFQPPLLFLAGGAFIFISFRKTAALPEVWIAGRPNVNQNNPSFYE